MFNQLCTFTSFSFSSSALDLKKYVLRAKELGFNCLGVCDSNIRCYPRFASICKEENIKPIFGYSFKLESKQIPFYKGYFYIKNEEGYLNLLKFFLLRKDILSLDDIKEYASGLILVIQVDNDDFFYDYFLTVISKEIFNFKKVFNDDFYFGLTINNQDESSSSSVFRKYCLDNNYNLLSFPEVRYLYKNDAELLELLKSYYSKRLAEINIISGPHFLLSSNAVSKLYSNDEIETTQKLVDSCSFEFFKKRGSLIKIDNDAEILKEKAYAGLKSKVKDCSSVYIDRLNYELNVISEMNFSSYFLVVEDYVNYAKSVFIKVGPGRGSVGGSLVSYCLNISEVDPIKYDLSFERFLNPKRHTMPDIDLDFESNRRNEVLSYLERKYSPLRVSTIRTFTLLKPKSAYTLVGNALNMNKNRISKITKFIFKNASTFTQALKDPILGYKLANELKDPYFAEVANKAERLIGLPLELSEHAPGVILSNIDISLCCPREEGKMGTVEFEYPYMEMMGFLKFDILSLDNLSFIGKIEKRIVDSNKELVNVQDNLNDKETFKTLNECNLTYVFQLDATFGMKEAVNSVKPDSLSSLADLLALYRPGPKEYIPLYAKRKNNNAKIDYLDERLKPILDETYGIMIYQEQVMKVLQAIANFSLADADLFRRAISKKDLSKMQSYYDVFIQGAIQNGISKENAEKIYADIEKFADYGFNKAHAYEYALITYTLLYYKTHYPVEFYTTAFLNCSFGDKTCLDLLKELNLKNIHCHLPNINISNKKEIKFVDNRLYPSLCFVTRVDESVVDKIIEERQKGEFLSFYNFCQRLCSKLNKKDYETINRLIYAGAFDRFSKQRKQLVKNLPTYMDFASNFFNENEIPQIDSLPYDLGEFFVLEKENISLILSKKLSSIIKKDSYNTMIVMDVSSFEVNDFFYACDERNIYRVYYDTKINVHKYDFILVKGKINKKTSEVQGDVKANMICQAYDIINCGRKVINNG